MVGLFIYVTSLTQWKMVGGSPLLRYLKRAKRTANTATDGQIVWSMLLYVCASVHPYEFVCEESWKWYNKPGEEEFSFSVKSIIMLFAEVKITEKTPGMFCFCIRSNKILLNEIAS